MIHMYNLYSKKSTTQGYDSQNVVQVIEAECKNTESKCNFCDGKIYWNPCVIHRYTKKRLPLSKPYTAHGTTPIHHRGCVYNTDDHYNKVVILEKDSPYIKAKKSQIQDRLAGVDESGLTLVERLIRDRTPEEIERCNEFLKHCHDYTFDSSSMSGINPTKVLEGMKGKKK